MPNTVRLLNFKSGAYFNANSKLLFNCFLDSNQNMTPLHNSGTV